MLTPKDLSGAWTLVTFETEKDGVFAPWGANLVGLLIYTSDGYISASMNRNSGLKSFDPLLDSLFYAGTYSINGNEVSHQVTVATSASRIGTTLLRTARRAGDTLELSGTSEQGRPFRLVWKKA